MLMSVRRRVMRLPQSSSDPDRTVRSHDAGFPVLCEEELSVGTGVGGGSGSGSGPPGGRGVVITDGEESQMLLWDRLMHAG